jgi:predicted RNA-binding Zn ribbon-like protein
MVSKRGNVDSDRLAGLADHRALDFLNTARLSGRVAVEQLLDGQAYLSWLERAGLVDARDAAAIARRFTAAELDTAAAAAVTLREWLRPVVAAWSGTTAVGGAGLPEPVRRRLNEILAAGQQYAELGVAGDGRPGLGVRWHWQQPRQLLVPPAGAAAQLLAAGDPGLARRCEGRDCTLWFYDRTKAGRRRWCSMATCGNREKNRNHRARDRAAHRQTLTRWQAGPVTSAGLMAGE